MNTYRVIVNVLYADGTADSWTHERHGRDPLATLARFVAWDKRSGLPAVAKYHGGILSYRTEIKHA